MSRPDDLWKIECGEQRIEKQSINCTNKIDLKTASSTILENQTNEFYSFLQEWPNSKTNFN